MRWAVDNVLEYAPVDAVVPTGAAMPRWEWRCFSASTSSPRNQPSSPSGLRNVGALLGEEVALGDHAEQLAVLHDGHTRDVVLDEQRRDRP